MIFLPSAVSLSTSALDWSAAGSGDGVSTFDGSLGVIGARIREMGGSMVRLVASSIGPRFGFGRCGSIRETLSTGCFTGAGSGGAAGAEVGIVTGFFPVIGAKADLVTAGLGVSSRTGADVEVGFAPAGGFSLLEIESGASALAALTGLEVAPGRVDDLGAAVGFAVLRTAGALGAFDLVVVVLVAIKIPQKSAHGRERLGVAMVRVRPVLDAQPHKFREPSRPLLQGCRQDPGSQRRANPRDW